MHKEFGQYGVPSSRLGYCVQRLLLSATRNKMKKREKEIAKKTRFRLKLKNRKQKKSKNHKKNRHFLINF